MNTSSAQHEPARTRRLASLAVAALLAAGIPAAGAGAAQAAAPQTALAASTLAAKVTKTSSTKVKPTLSLTRSSTRQVKGETRVKITIKARRAGKAVPGTAKIYLKGKHVKTVSMPKGKASYKLPNSLRTGKHTVKVSFTPTASTTTTSAGTRHPLVGTSRSVKVKVVSASQAIRSEALKHRGVRYRYGGTSPKTGFDCSGFVSYVYKKAGIASLPTSSSAMRHVGKVVSKKKAKVGDIIWTPGHVAIYLGGNKQIDAPRPGKTIQVREIWQSNPVFIHL